MLQLVGQPTKQTTTKMPDKQQDKYALRVNKGKSCSGLGHHIPCPWNGETACVLMASVTGENSAGGAASMQIPSGPPHRGTDTPKHTPVLGPVTLSPRVKSPWRGGVLSLCFPGCPSSSSLLISGVIQVGQKQSLSLPSSLTPLWESARTTILSLLNPSAPWRPAGTAHVAAQALFEVFACLTRQVPAWRCCCPDSP